MLEKLFALMSMSPTISIILIFLLAGFLVYLLKDVIKDIVKKRFGLYDENEVQEALNRALNERKLYDKVPEKLVPTVEERVLKFLKQRHND